ncbi:hypothetical protein [Nocardia sp. NBC_01327]|uniref:hypothetical protein n=1 Tax=Nocardia sp. NBC_01327 TaxID=2903593 RepID=UPI002E11BC13|nr:hypothetical protein OG326_23745 [Nocardia sp. NBC_01327]
MPWEVTYDNRSQNPETWSEGTDNLEADTMLIRDGALKFTNEDSDAPVAVYAPGYWQKAKRTT